MDFPLITSRQHPAVQLVRSLHGSRGRKAQGAFLIEGRNGVDAALECGWPIRELFTTEAMRPLAARAAVQNIPVRLVTEPLLEYACEANTSVGIVAVADIPDRQSIPTQLRGLTLVIDGVSDPGNVGTLLRAADAVGAGAVFLTAGSADAWSPKVVRSAAGSLFHLNLYTPQGRRPEELLALIQARNLPVITAEAHGGTSCYDYAWPGDCCLVLGHETRGISAPFQSAATARCTIPIYGRAESLNAAMAGTLLLYAWRQSSGS